MSSGSTIDWDKPNQQLVLDVANKRRKLAEAIIGDESYTTTRIAAVIESFTTEFLNWTPATVMAEIKSEFGQSPTDLAADQIGLGMTLLTTDDFYQKPDRFITACNVLSGSQVTEMFDPADAAECAWGITEALMLAPPESEEPFSEEVLLYISRVLSEEGITNPPAVLRLGTRHAGGPNLKGLSVDDPAMFAAEYGVVASKSEEILEMLQENTAELLQQLDALPVAGDSAGFLGRVQKSGATG